LKISDATNIVVFYILVVEVQQIFALHIIKQRKFTS
jgi:hypothetical protein